MTRLQLNDPLPRERIVTTLEGAVNGGEISGAFKFDPMELLSRYFSEPPRPGTLVPTITPSSGNLHSPSWSPQSETTQGLYSVLAEDKLVQVCMVKP